MAFVSRNPQVSMNPEAAEDCTYIESKNLVVGSEIIGYYKNMYVEPEYKNKCYVIKGKDDGKDYLIYGVTSLHNEMVNYSQGELLCLKYKGIHQVKKGRFAGKDSHIWAVACENTWAPTPDFVSQLQQEIQQRRMQVQALSSSYPAPQQRVSVNPYQQPQQMQMGGFSQPSEAPMQQNSFSQPATFVAPISPSNFGEMPKKKSVDPFG